jgi:hypothetical protein
MVKWHKAVRNIDPQLLLVLKLFVLAPKIKPLPIQVAAITVAHSVTFSG